MGEKISLQEVRLKAQDERQKGSIHDISAVPSAHSDIYIVNHKPALV